MKRLIFTLAGISLLDEKKGLLGRGEKFKGNLKEIEECNIKAIITNSDILRNQKKQVLDLWAGKNIRDNISKFSAEIASLYYLKPQALDNKDDKIILLLSETQECAFAGIVNGKFIIYRRTDNRDWDSIIFKESNDVFSRANVEIKIIKGLQINDGQKFVSEGIKNLFTFMHNKIVDEGASYDEIILNITGGYKGTIPYLSLFGMLYQERKIKGKKIKPLIEYLYEESEDIITLPNLPVAFDIFTWRNYRGFIEAVPHLESEVAETILGEILPAQISGLFEEGGDKKPHLTKLGEILRENYREEKEGELTPYGRGYLLLDKIQDDDGKKQKALQDCINRWQYLWLGDLIPETVEHARGHTQRVLELAAQILYPILNNEDKFFGNEEQTNNNLIALISAIWLHDFGHSGNYLKCKHDETTIRDVPDVETGIGIIEYDIKGFPSQVRDMHHLLSWYLIGKDRVELFDNSAFDDNLIEAIRQICLYHRGKMPVLEKPDPDNPELKNHESYKHIGIQIKEPLEKISREKVNLPLLGALLRIADGGDVQEERTISENYKAMRFLQNRRELKMLEQEEKEYREKVDALFAASLSSQLPEHLAKLKNFAREYFSKKPSEQDNQYKEVTKMVDNCVRKYIHGDGLECIEGVRKIIIHNWLSALDQYVFKKSPGPHFEKHAGISAVMYLVNNLVDKNGMTEYHYKVRAIHKKDKDKEKMNKRIENAEKVLKDIFCEYKKVEKILNAHRIYFDFYERLEEGEDEMKPVLPKEPSDTAIERICL
jgi:CRISPR/Cas system-associated protein Csm6